MKKLLCLFVMLFYVGCSDEKELRMLGKAHNNLQNTHEKAKKEIIKLKVQNKNLKEEIKKLNEDK